ncbi:MAG: hypothetical protein AB8B56_07660 [Crocinitomicaceae bacterium]
MKFNIILLILGLASFSVAQNDLSDDELVAMHDSLYNYKWEETFDKTKFEPISAGDREATIVLDKTIFVHRPRSTSESKPMRRKFTHQIYQIHQESAIEKMNELYLYQGGSKVSKVFVRTIDSEGNVVVFDESKLEDVSKNEGGSSYKILAIPGIKVGSWVEVLIHYTGFSSQSRVLTREPFDILNSEVIYITALPKQERDGKIDPKMTGLNGYEYISREIFDLGRNMITYKAENIPAQMTDESYVHDFLECPRVDLTTDTYVWREMSNGIHRNYLALETILNRSGKVQKLLMEIGADGGSELSKITAIEAYIKEEITRTEEEGIPFEHSQKVIKNKVANIQGIIMLYKTLFENCDIEYKPYLVYDKDYVCPEETMPMSMGLSDFIFYFPNSDVYVMPESNYYRVGKLANYLCGMPALFLRDNFGTINGDDYLITLPDAEKEYNVDRSINRVTYNEDDESLSIKTAKHYFGDRAIRERGALNFMDNTEKDEHVKDILVSKLEDATLTNVRMLKSEIGYNTNSTDSMIYTGKIVTEDMISPIGNGFLLNLPKIIGNQVSFYDEGTRVHNVYSPVAKIYDHTIEFVIPEGYEVQGVENLQFERNYHTEIDGESKWISSFVSKAEVKDGVLHVDVHEFYEEGMFPMSEIDQYRSVVNAAYEFYIAQIKVVQK